MDHEMMDHEKHIIVRSQSVVPLVDSLNQSLFKALAQMATLLAYRSDGAIEICPVSLRMSPHAFRDVADRLEDLGDKLCVKRLEAAEWVPQTKNSD